MPQPTGQTPASGTEARSDGPRRVRRGGTLAAIVLVCGLLGVSAIALADCPRAANAPATAGPHSLDAVGLAFIKNNELSPGYYQRYLTTKLVNGKPVPAVHPYRDSVHWCTAGYGHLIQPKHKGCTKSDYAKYTWTDAEMQAHLMLDLRFAINAVNNGVTVPLTQAQFDALVDFTFNAGAGEDYWARSKKTGKRKLVHNKYGLKGSGLLAAMNAGDLAKAEGIIAHYDHQARRALEVRMFRGEPLCPPPAKPVGRHTPSSRKSTGKRRGGGHPRQGVVVVPLPNHGGTQVGVLPAPSNGGGVSVVPVPVCGDGGVDVLLYGQFFGQEWAAGEVKATNGEETQTALEGYDYVSMGHFGPWQCGTTTTLTATPSRGNHFVRWESSEGLCANAGPTCTFTVKPGAAQLTAYFAPTVYQLSVTNEQPDGIVSNTGGGYLDPGIHCGSEPNGPKTEVFEECRSGAIAQRSEEDVTTLNISADSPGPGGGTYAVASVDGCDRYVASKAELPQGGGEYVYNVQCFIDMNSDRAVTVSYKGV